MKALLAAKWAQFSGWLAWSAWNYARNREITRHKWRIGTVNANTDDMTPDQRRIRSNEARQLLENRHFIEAFDAVWESLETSAQTAENKPEIALRIMMAKQLLQGIRREIVRKLDDGFMAEVQLYELERRNKPLRMVR